jgi:uncharacterized protein YjbI with pentapeptide repeats
LPTVAQLSARDRDAVLRLLQAAQTAYALSRFPKRQVLDTAVDRRRLHDSIAKTRAASAELSTALRERTAIKWNDLIADAADDEASWRIAKRVVPTLFAELGPLLGNEPEASFLPVVRSRASGRPQSEPAAATAAENDAVDRASHVDTTFAARNWSHQRLERAEFDDCVFERCDFSTATLAHCRFASCRFVRCDFSNAKLPSSRFRDVRFESTKLLGVDWSKSDGMADAHAKTALAFADCVLDLSSFFGLNLRGALIERCSAKETDFTEADLRDSVCAGTDFTDARFHDSNLERADLRRASNYSIDPRANRLKGARFSLPDAVALLRGLEIVVE